MSPADVSVFVFAIYVALVGVGYFLFAKPLVAKLKENPAVVGWVRIVGVLSLGLAFYYFYVSLTGLSSFYMATVYARYGVLVLFTGLAVTSKNYQLIAFGLIDAAGATWTLLTIL